MHVAFCTDTLAGSPYHCHLCVFCLELDNDACSCVQRHSQHHLHASTRSVGIIPMQGNLKPAQLTSTSSITILLIALRALYIFFFASNKLRRSSYCSAFRLYFRVRVQALSTNHCMRTHYAASKLSTAPSLSCYLVSLGTRPQARSSMQRCGIT